VSPILVRPVREQLEHDRVIRLLQQDLSKRKVEVGINPGTEQNAAVGAGSRKEYPDAVLYALDKGRKIVAVVEVETGESVNHLEAMAQWAHLAKLKVPFHLYVPMGSVDVARRLSADYHIPVTEIWSYHQVGEQFRFTPIQPVGRGSRASQPAARTVSVATIRVARLPEIEPSVEEPAPPAPQAPAAKTPAGTGKVIPPKSASVKVKAGAAAAPAADQKGSGVKAAAPPPGPARPVAAKTGPTKTVAAKAVPPRPAPAPARKAAAKPAETRPAKAAAPKATAAARPKPVGVKAATKPVARPAKPGARATAPASRPAKARQAARSTRLQRPAVKAARKAGARPASRAAGKRK
jgi:hypothetical protein